MRAKYSRTLLTRPLLAHENLVISHDWEYVKTEVSLINTKSSSTRYYTHHLNAQVHTYDFSSCNNKHFQVNRFTEDLTGRITEVNLWQR